MFKTQAASLTDEVPDGDAAQPARQALPPEPDSEEA